MFYNRGDNMYLWSSTEFDASYARGRYLDWDGSSVYRGYWDKNFGFSVRCIKDSEPIITQTDCESANWMWVSSSNDVYI